jgi:hypothetical protein
MSGRCKQGTAWTGWRCRCRDSSPCC